MLKVSNLTKTYGNSNKKSVDNFTEITYNIIVIT